LKEEVPWRKSIGAGKKKRDQKKFDQINVKPEGGKDERVKRKPWGKRLAGQQLVVTKERQKN